MIVNIKGSAVTVLFLKDRSTATRLVFEATSPGDGGRYCAIFIVRDGKWIVSSESYHLDLGSRRIPRDLFTHFLVARRRISAMRTKIDEARATKAVKAALRG